MTESIEIEEELPRPAVPATTQSHGTILLGIIAGFVVLGLLLRLTISGVGPFHVQLVDSTSTGTELTVTLRITNEGDRAGRANCRVPLANEANVVQPPKTVLTQRIEPGETITEVITLTVPDGVRPSGSITC